MNLISLAAAITLTDWSERTFWRRFAEGSVARRTENGKSMVDLEEIRSHISIPLEEKDIILIRKADEGNAEAQNDLALIFLANEKAKSALYWLDLASRQEYPDAMHWLGRLYLEGNGVTQDENLGMMWLSKSAACGHLISKAQMQAMRDQFLNNK